MSRQGDAKAEQRESAKQHTLVKALSFGIVDELEFSGIELLGFSFKYDAFNCLMTVKADIAGERQVAFVGSDTLINCILKTYSEARNGGLRWRADQYHDGKV